LSPSLSAGAKHRKIAGLACTHGPRRQYRRRCSAACGELMRFDYRKQISAAVESNEMTAQSGVPAAENRHQLDRGEPPRPNGGHGKQGTGFTRAFAAVDGQALRRNERRLKCARDDRQNFRGLQQASNRRIVDKGGRGSDLFCPSADHSV
jgi:hypothetical protein